MRLRILISALFVLVPTVRAADVQWPNKLGRWVAVPDEAVHAGTNGQAGSPLFKESGLVATSSRVYRDGDRALPLTIYTFHDSSGAYEAYTFLRGAAAAMGTNNALVQKGNVVLWVRGVSDSSSDDLKEILTWEQSISDHIPSPPVATYLPEQGKEPFTERYALGAEAFREAAKALGRENAARFADQAGFNSGAEAMLARYKSGANEGLLLLIEYPTPQLAELHLRHMQRAILAEKQGASIERKGSLLSIVLAPTSQEYAERLRAAVNYETQVTWSEPGATATDPPWSSVLAKIFIGTFVFMVVAVVLGVAFGGVRVITKRLFPGKVFDRPHQIEVLQLGLSSKPIDPQDLY
jgi:hypothetical protein